MRTLILSDIHLTSDFEQNKYDYLKKLFESVDRVILNGDFWCVFTCTFDEFLGSKWQQLFPLLKTKHAIYVTGNHDYKTYVDDRVLAFCDWYGEEYRLREGDTTYVIRHGHDIVPIEYDLTPKHVSFSRKWGEMKLMYFIQNTLLDIFGVDFTHTFIDFLMRENVALKKYAKENLSSNEILVCGHSHAREFSLSEKYINLGFNFHGYGSYLLIEDGVARLVKERF